MKYLKSLGREHGNVQCHRTEIADISEKLSQEHDTSVTLGKNNSM